MVRRYFCNDSDGESCGLLHEHPDGVCVEYLDYQKLEAENARLRAAFNGDVGSLADCNELNKELVEALEEIELFGHGRGHGRGYTCAEIAQAALDKVKEFKDGQEV